MRAANGVVTSFTHISREHHRVHKRFTLFYHVNVVTASACQLLALVKSGEGIFGRAGRRAGTCPTGERALKKGDHEVGETFTRFPITPFIRQEKVPAGEGPFD